MILLSGEIYMMVLSYRFTDDFWVQDSYRQNNILKAVNRIVNDESNELIHLKTYKGIRYDSDVIFWMSSYKPEALTEVRFKINRYFGGYAGTNYGMISLYEHSPYLKKDGELSDTLTQEPLKYFVAYPMSKLSEWYLMDYEERKKILAEHIGMASSSPESKGIRSYTTYSHGLDDQEFVVLYEVESLSDWSHVTAKLREARARKWIIKETPIITGVLADLDNF